MAAVKTRTLLPEEVVEPVTPLLQQDQAAKPQKKTRRSKKKKSKQSAADITAASGSGGSSPSKAPLAVGVPSVLPSHRGVQGFADYYVKYGQTAVPSIPVSQLFAGGAFPQGEHMEHPGDFNTFRTTDSEKRALELANSDLYDSLREAAEVQRQVRHYGHQIIKPGAKLIDVCNAMEDMNRKLVGENGQQRGIGFPTGCSLNHVAAHYTPNNGDDTVITENDVCKVDFGTQINGRIIDCAFTVAFQEKYDPLLEAAREATNAGIRAAGIDVALGDIGGVIQEVMESYEIELDGKTYPIKPIRNLMGHNIAPYNIHGGKSVPSVKTPDRTRMEEGEVFAIETFASTGRGAIDDGMECSHYKKNVEAPFTPLRLKRSRDLLKHLDKTFGTLPFCRRWLERPDGGSAAVNGQNGKQTRYLGALNQLVEADIIEACPPLLDIKGCYTAQYEHTFILKPTRKEVLSRGSDF